MLDITSVTKIRLLEIYLGEGCAARLWMRINTRSTGNCGRNNSQWVHENSWNTRWSGLGTWRSADGTIGLVLDWKPEWSTRNRWTDVVVKCLKDPRVRNWREMMVRDRNKWNDLTTTAAAKNLGGWLKTKEKRNSHKIPLKHHNCSRLFFQKYEDTLEIRFIWYQIVWRN